MLQQQVKLVEIQVEVSSGRQGLHHRYGGYLIPLPSRQQMEELIIIFILTIQSIPTHLVLELMKLYLKWDFQK